MLQFDRVVLFNHVPGSLGLFARLTSEHAQVVKAGEETRKATTYSIKGDQNVRILGIWLDEAGVLKAELDRDPKDVMVEMQAMGHDKKHLQFNLTANAVIENEPTAMPEEELPSDKVSPVAKRKAWLRFHRRSKQVYQARGIDGLWVVELDKQISPGRQVWSAKLYLNDSQSVGSTDIRSHKKFDLKRDACEYAEQQECIRREMAKPQK